ncbi:hypothetical protein LY78DRAFT_487808 [Colletotrichum sublineola]|nr:hypothetical protein LY78DRAFT_487808 [Colletotrichum sublineola]
MVPIHAMCVFSVLATLGTSLFFPYPSIWAPILARSRFTSTPSLQTHQLSYEYSLPHPRSLISPGCHSTTYAPLTLCSALHLMNTPSTPLWARTLARFPSFPPTLSPDPDIFLCWSLPLLQNKALGYASFPPRLLIISRAPAATPAHIRLDCHHTPSVRLTAASLTRTVLAHLLQLLLPPSPPATSLCLFNYITADHNLFARTHDVLQQDRKNQSSLSIQQTRAQVQETCPLSHLQLLFCVLRRAHPSEHLQSLLAPNHLQPDSHSIFCRARTCAT